VIINRALVKEVLISTGAVATIILSIFLVGRSVQFLREAAQGSLPVDSVFVLLLLKMVTYLDVIIPLILFVAILMVLGRWYKDNEMTVGMWCWPSNPAQTDNGSGTHHRWSGNGVLALSIPIVFSGGGKNIFRI